MSQTIKIEENNQCVTQNSFYFQNFKLALTEPITSSHVEAIFRIDNLKYCVGFGLAFKEVIENH